jgi:hypothetical protein
LPGRCADLTGTGGGVHMKAETTVNGPQTSPKMASTGTRQAARPRKRVEGGIAPRKSASGGYNDGVGGWKWEIPAKDRATPPLLAIPSYTITRDANIDGHIVK